MGRDRLAARRRELGLSQEQLAYALGHDPTTIGRWERGETTPQPLHRAPLARALQVTLPELTALLADTAPAPLPAYEHPDPTAELRATTRQLIDLDTRHGGDDLLLLAVRSFRSASARLSAEWHDGSRDGIDMACAVAEAGQVAAWIAHDADDQALSRRLHHEALVLARLAGDRGMELFLLASLAMHAAHIGDGPEAIRMADSVLEAGALTPRLRALFLLRRARGLALTHDRRPAIDTLAESRSLLADGPSDRDPTWTWWMSDAELAWHEAMIHAHTDDWPTAVDSFASARAQRGTHLRRSHYNDTAHLWHALVTVGAWHDAEPVATDLVTGADTLRSGRTRTLLRRAITQIDRAPTIPPPLADATAELRRSVAP